MILTQALGLVPGLFELIDKLFTSDEERERLKIQVMELAQKGDLGQLGINMKEAEHPSIFVAGWRPFVGWACGSAMALNFIVLPLLQAILIFWQGHEAPVLPVLDLSVMLPVLLGMLGLGAMRTYEKDKGTARSEWRGATPLSSGAAAPEWVNPDLNRPEGR